MGMNVTAEFGTVIGRVFAEAAEEAATFPGRLGESGRAWIDRCNPLNREGDTNAITFLLPFWLREWAGGSERMCRDMAVGNVFAMLHFFLLDDAMDGGTGTGGSSVRDNLALGQLFCERFSERYGRHFAADSELWERYRAYLDQWAEAVSEEGGALADPRDSERLAAKSAPVKLCAAGLLISCGREEEIGQAEEAVELALATLQLSDDRTDWQEDLAAGEERSNAFLTLAREALAWPKEEPLTESAVKQAIYREGALDRLNEIVLSFGERLKGMANAPGRLVFFHDSIADELVNDARAAENATNVLAAGGGFSYFLSQITKR